MLKRKIYDKLLEWKQKKDGATALMIEGARRIGKSYIAESFARNEYESYILIDFTKTPSSVKSWFNEYLEDVNTLLENIQLHYRKRLPIRKSLIIFDEVQACPRAREAIKALVSDRRFDYIETGSLISIKKNVKDILIPSEEDAVDMYPLDFEEFLWAMGDEMMMPYIRKQFDAAKPMGEFHRRAMDYFRKYMIIGGMPQAVNSYIESRDFTAVDSIKRQILRLYRNDIRKYADNYETKVTAIFDEIPAQLSRHEKKFRLSSLKDDARMRDYEDSFFWLDDAKIINCCYNTSEPGMGLRLNEERTTLKCYMADTGLLLSHTFNTRGLMSKEIYQKLMFDKLEINEGMLVENIVAQMLKAGGHKLYFYSRSDENPANRMEIDFLIQKETVTSRHNISPIEVKSGQRYALSSLRKCMDKFGESLATPYVLHSKDVKVEGGIFYLPLYMAAVL